MGDRNLEDDVIPLINSGPALSEDRIKDAYRHWTECRLCAHDCGANRTAGERGPCKAGVETRVFRHRVEYGEELELVPSHLFYVSGCDLRCAFCIAEANAFDPRRGTLLTVEYLAEALELGRLQGSRNLQWVGGEPTIHLPNILRVMAGCVRLPPVVWKSDFFGTPDVWRLLDGIVSTYVADLKFGNNECARRIAGVNRYFETVTSNLKIVVGTTDLILRHLLLPGHFECCFEPIVRWIQRELPEVKFSIRDGYLPRWQARHYPELATPLSSIEGTLAKAFASKHGLNLIS